MTLELMNTSTDKRYLSKSTSLIKEVTCKIKEGTSIINPTVVIEKMSASHIRKCNYAHISDFGRYYFINDIIETTANRLEISMHVDVLKTYKASILDSKQLIIAENDKGKMYLSNREWVTDERTYTRCYNFDGDHFSTKNDSFVLVCV